MAAPNLDEGHGRRRRAGRRLGYAAGAGPAGDTAAAASARAVDDLPERPPEPVRGHRTALEARRRHARRYADEDEIDRLEELEAELRRRS